MPYVGFEPTIPASEQVKTFQALDRAAIVTGINPNIKQKLEQFQHFQSGLTPQRGQFKFRGLSLLR
jgi:hypothetical protein